MFFHVQRLINEIVPDEPDPAAANALQEGLGGQFGEMRTMMQYLFQSFNFRGPTGKPFRDLLYGVGTEEIGHVELIATTIARLRRRLARATRATPTRPRRARRGRRDAAVGGARGGNIHHWLVGAQGALPVDAQGDPWTGKYVYDSGNLPLNLLYNLMLESTGRLQKCRLYEMTANKTARSTIAYLIVRDQAHENAYAKALEALGVEWNKLLPIPKTNAEQFPEVKTLLDQGLQSKQYTFSLDQLSEAGQGLQGPLAVEGRHGALHRAGPRGRADGDRGRAPGGVRARPGPRADGARPGHRRDGDVHPRRPVRADRQLITS